MVYPNPSPTPTPPSQVKVLQKPKFDLTKLMEMHGDSVEDTGAALDKVAAANTVKSLKGAGGRL
ncbi:hypothetical protein EON63_06610 [archaeon]|nr:MAG: hypothetical protein EON63_06610 [archaeon]